MAGSAPGVTEPTLLGHNHGSRLRVAGVYRKKICVLPAPEGFSVLCGLCGLL